MLDPASLSDSPLFKSRAQVDADLREARTIIGRALRNLDRLTPGQVISMATAAQQVLLCDDDSRIRSVVPAVPKPGLRSV